MGPIQRYPLGMLETLGVKGTPAPSNLSETILPTFELMQFYGSQKQVAAVGNAALPEGTTISVLPAPVNWMMIFGITLTITKTATMTALRGTVGIRLNSDVFQELGLRDEALGPFGATETGTVTVAHWFPYPFVAPPNTLIVGRAPIIGTDATCNAVLGSLIAILG